MDLTTDQLIEIAFDAVTSGPSELPEALEAHVLAAGRRAPRLPRHAGWSTLPTLHALDAFVRTASEVGELLDALDDDEWSRPTRVDDASVRQIVNHMVGVERYVLGCLGRRPRLDAPRRQDHWPISTQAAADVSDEPDRVMTAIWWSEVLDLVAASAELGPDHEVFYHHLAGSLQGMLVVRTFELWTHGDDIRRATGRPLDTLDEERLSLMVGELMRVLPLGLAISDCPQPGRTARLTLTGPGGGTFDVSLDPASPAGEPDITVSATTIDLCRVAANRLDVADFDVDVAGDATLLGPLLVGAAAFAAD
jgi:uncharacterized protein (TIGR03083 family)